MNRSANKKRTRLNRNATRVSPISAIGEIGEIAGRKHKGPGVAAVYVRQRQNESLLGSGVKARGTQHAAWHRWRSEIR